MPWKETTVPDDRIRFIALYLDRVLSMAELCREFRISRKTGYKFVRRYDLYGPEGLLDLPRIAYRHPNAVDDELQEQIIVLRAAHPTWGPRKLLAVLVRDLAHIDWPCSSTIGAILKRRGLSVPRRHRRCPLTSATSLTQSEQPNHVWCADYKGDFPLTNGQRCYPLTITDAFSRAIIKCQALPSTSTDYAWPVWQAAFQQYGMPNIIRTDNGAPFASNGYTGLTRLSAWWIKLGIRPERIKPASPQQNGQHERMHLTLKQEATKPPQPNLSAQQRVFDHFKHEYNCIRPHEALGQVTPHTLYLPSPRPYPLMLSEPEYPSGMRVRRVRRGGEIRFNSELIFISETLAGEPVGLDQLDDRHWAIYFAFMPIAILDQVTNAWLKPKLAQPILTQLRKEIT
jgi:putative transposase